MRGSLNGLLTMVTRPLHGGSRLHCGYIAYLLLRCLLAAYRSELLVRSYLFVLVCIFDGILLFACTNERRENLLPSKSNLIGASMLFHVLIGQGKTEGPHHAQTHVLHHQRPNDAP